jgi:membrane protease YdiL (CAAX protease family)
MQDPTVETLSAAFGLAAVLAFAGALWRAGSLRIAAAQPGQPPPLPGGRVPVWFFRPVDLLGVLFVFGVFGRLALGQAGSTQGDMSATVRPEMLLLSIAFQCFMAGVVLVLLVRRADPVLALGLRWRRWPMVLLLAPVSVIGMMYLFKGLEVFGYMRWMQSLGVETMQDSVKLLKQSQDPWVVGLMAVAAVVVAPVCEEIVFRGYCHGVLKRCCGLWPAALVSSLVFGCVHGHLAAALPLACFGVVLVLLYEKTGSLWAPVSAHFLFNGTTVVVQAIARHYGIDAGGGS